MSNNFFTTWERVIKGMQMRHIDREAITKEKFLAATGNEPQHDDLDRCNCPHAGAIGHLCCGWNPYLDKPQFMLGPRAWNGKEMPAVGQPAGDRE